VALDCLSSSRGLQELPYTQWRAPPASHITQQIVHVSVFQKVPRTKGTGYHW
jgi:hypothetical protein